MSMILNPYQYAAAGGGDNYLLLDGTGDYADAPLIPAYNPSTSLSIRAKIAADDYVGASSLAMISGTWVGSYVLAINTNGKLSFSSYSPSFSSQTSTAPLTTSDGDVVWIRADWSSAGTVDFYTSIDGASWTALGAQVSGAPSSIRSSSFQMTIGSQNDGAAYEFAGKIYDAETIVDGVSEFHAEFSSQTPGVSSFTESSANAATVTLHGNASIIAG